MDHYLLGIGLLAILWVITICWVATTALQVQVLRDMVKQLREYLELEDDPPGKQDD